MKHSITKTLAAALVVSSLNFNAVAAPRSGEVDFGKSFGLRKDAGVVEINLKRTMMCLAAMIVEDREPEAASLLRSMQLVRVNVIGLTDRNRNVIGKGLEAVRGQLSKEGWDRVVTAPEKNGEDVGVYMKTKGNEVLEGLVVMMTDGNKKKVVLVNLVGDIKPEQIATVGRALDIEPLRKVGRAIQK